MNFESPSGRLLPRTELAGPSAPLKSLAGLNRRLSRWVQLLIFLFCASPGCAHDTGSSYLKLTVQERHIVGRWEIALHDLDEALKLDDDDDHTISSRELQARHQALNAYAIAHLEIAADGVTKVIQITNAEPAVERLSNGTNVILSLLVAEAPKPAILEVDYRLFFTLKPQHRGLLLVECDGRTQTAMFSPERPRQRFDLTVPRSRREFLAFGWQGVWHIWVGFDHILFLLALLLPAVLVPEGKRWTAVTGFRQAFFNVFKIVTAFTVAHSITLSLASLRVVTLPSRWVESAIAASVLLAAVNNLRPFFHGRAWLVAAGFGLVHGFGFASVLAELGLPQNSLLVALVGFNLGVEVGQVAIVAVFLPLAYGLRASWIYPALFLRAGSLSIALLAGIWFVERACSLSILGAFTNHR